MALIIYDGDCALCKASVEWGRRVTRGRVAFAPYQEAAGSFPQIPVEEFRRAVQLVLPDGEVASGAHAVFRALALGGAMRWLYWMYRHAPGFARLTEAVYRWVARHRSLVWRVAGRVSPRA